MIAEFMIDAWRPCAAASQGEIAERGFFSLDALPTGVSPGTRARLDECFGGAPRASRWSP